MVLAAVDASLVVLNAVPVHEAGSDIVIDTELSGASDSASDLIEHAILAPLNRKSGMTCFSLAGVDPGKDAVASEVHVLYDSACTSAATIDRLGTAPAEALTGAPAEDAKQQPAPVTT